MLARAPGALAVRRDLGVATMDEFVALAKQRGRDLTVASTGTGTVSHLTGIMFQQQMDLPPWTDVPYAGSAKAVTDLLGGHVDAMFSMVVPLVPHVERGDLKLIAVTTRTRSPTLPDVPTVAETTTLKDFDVINWTALLAPAGTPRTDRCKSSPHRPPRRCTIRTSSSGSRCSASSPRATDPTRWPGRSAAPSRSGARWCGNPE